MADSKVSALPNKATLDGTELVMIVDDPSGTPTSKRTTAQAIADLGDVKMLALGASQTGTNDPTYLEFGNNSGFNILVFQRNSTGNYGIILDGPIDHQKTAVIVSGVRGFAKGYAIVGNEMTILTYNTSNVAADAILSSTQIIILFFQ